MKLFSNVSLIDDWKVNIIKAFLEKKEFGKGIVMRFGRSIT